MAWIQWYIGVGAVVMTLVMGVHLKYQECSRSTRYHVIEALVLWLVWPILIVIGVSGGVWIHKKTHQDHDSEER